MQPQAALSGASEELQFQCHTGSRDVLICQNHRATLGVLSLRSAPSSPNTPNLWISTHSMISVQIDDYSGTAILSVGIRATTTFISANAGLNIIILQRMEIENRAFSDPQVRLLPICKGCHKDDRVRLATPPSSWGGSLRLFVGPKMARWGTRTEPKRVFQFQGSKGSDAITLFGHVPRK